MTQPADSTGSAAQRAATSPAPDGAPPASPAPDGAPPASPAPDGAPPASPILDPTTLDAIRALDEDVDDGLDDGPGGGSPRPPEERRSLLAEVATMLLEDAPLLLGELRVAVEAGQPEAVRFSAHRLKGSCRELGATRLADVAAELEAVARAGELAGAPELLRRIEAEFVPVAAALRELEQAA